MSPNRKRRWPSLLGVGLFALGQTACFDRTPSTIPTPAVVATAAPAATPIAVAPRSVARPQFSAERALDHVAYFASTVGSRPAGSAAYDRAVDYAAARFAESGYQVDLQKFGFREYQVRRVAISQLSPIAGSIEGFPLENSISGIVEANLVDAGLGRPADFSSEVAGKVALIARGAGISFQDKVAAANAAGASAVVVYNDQPGMFRGTMQLASAIPVVSIPRETGLRLQQALSNGPVRLKVEVDAENRQVESSNVVARRPASGGIIVVGAHLDSVAAGPGANDNASGSAMTLELARVLSAVGLATELRFVLFGAEENGLIGSRKYVESLSPQDRERIRGMINLDMVGVGDRFRLGGSAHLVDIARAAADGLGQPSTDLPSGSSGGSDHASFIQAKLPAVFFYWQDDPDYHAPTDVATNVRLQTIQTTGTVALQTIIALDGE